MRDQGRSWALLNVVAMSAITRLAMRADGMNSAGTARKELAVGTAGLAVAALADDFDPAGTARKELAVGTARSAMAALADDYYPAGAGRGR